jgi:hypothetical protein
MKTLMARLMIGACLVAYLSGCASLRELVYGRPNALAPLTSATLGVTPRDDIIRQFGAPDEIDRRIVDSFDAEVMYYHDRDERKGPPIQSQFLACEFSKGVLNAYSYNDSAEPAQRSVDENERFKLVKGKSTRKDAERLLGIPAGRALLPTTITQAALAMKIGGAPSPWAKVPDDAKEAWLYFSENVDDYLHKTAQKTLAVFFDANGIYLGSSLMQELLIK